MIRNLLACVAATGLACAPIVAQANTRAATSGVSMAALDVARVASPVGAAEEAGNGIPMWLLILLFGTVGGAIILGVEAGENSSNKSPGT